MEFVLFEDAPLDPGFDEAKAIAHQLDEGCRDGEQSHPETTVADAGIDKDDK